jgi:membrane associated rhomboid family serine protease
LGSLCHWAVNSSSDQPVIGASGAVATVLGGYAVTFPWAMVRTLIFVFIADVPALVWLGMWFVWENVVPAVASLQREVAEPVAFWAHIGGFVAGLVLMPFMALGASPPGTDWRKEADDMFRFEETRNR